MYIDLVTINLCPGQGGGGVKPSGTLDISENGVYDVYSYASASVDVHPSISLSETYTSNGNYNITGEFNGGVIKVDVPAPQFVTETLNVSANGTYTPGQGIDGYSQVVVDVPISGWDQKSLTEGTNEMTNLDNSASFVASNAFYGNRKIQTVNLPYATSVGDYAFYYCRSLTNVNLPMCSYIGSSAFADCSSLSQVNLPMCSKIAGYAFQNCTNLNEVNLPVCSFINEFAFYNANLTSLTLGSNSVVSLSGDNQFYPTDILSIYVPGSLYSQYITNHKWISYSSYIFEPLMWYYNGTLGGSILEMSRTDWESLGISGADLQRVNFNYAGSFSTGTFKDCTNLSQVNLNNWQYTESEVFMGCTSLESITHTNLQQGRLILGDTRGLFSGCTNLSSLGSYIFDSLGDYMFAGTALTSYKFYPYTDYIGDYVFQNCTSLTEIDLNDMKSIVGAGTSIFDGCTNLSVIYINNEEYRTAQGWSEYSSLMSLINNTPALSFKNGLLYGSISAISSADWTALGISTTDIISVSLPNCLSVADQTFRTCYSLTSVSLPMCENLGLSAFQMCYILNSIYLPVVSIIGSYCFNTCSSLSSIMLPECINLNRNVFTGCSMLSTIVLPKLQTVDASVFRVLNNQFEYMLSLYMGGSDVVNTGTAVASKLFFSNVQKHIYVRSSLIGMYQQHSIWGQIDNVQWFNYEDSPYYTE